VAVERLSSIFRGPLIKLYTTHGFGKSNAKPTRPITKVLLGCHEARVIEYFFVYSNDSKRALLRSSHHLLSEKYSNTIQRRIFAHSTFAYIARTLELDLPSSSNYYPVSVPCTVRPSPPCSPWCCDQAPLLKQPSSSIPHQARAPLLKHPSSSTPHQAPFLKLERRSSRNPPQQGSCSCDTLA